MDYPEGQRKLAKEQKYDAGGYETYSGIAYRQAQASYPLLNGSRVENWVAANEQDGTVIWRDSFGNDQTSTGRVRIIIPGWWE